MYCGVFSANTFRRSKTSVSRYQCRLRFNMTLPLPTDQFAMTLNVSDCPQTGANWVKVFMARCTGGVTKGLFLAATVSTILYYVLHHVFTFPPLFSPLFRAVCPQVSKVQSPRRRRQRSVQRTPGLSSKEGRFNNRNQQLYTIMFGVKPNLLYIAWKLLTKLKKSNRLSCKNTRLRQMILVRYKSIVNQINYNNLHVNFLFIWQDISFLTGETLKLDVMQTSSDS